MHQLQPQVYTYYHKRRVRCRRYFSCQIYEDDGYIYENNHWFCFDIWLFCAFEQHFAIMMARGPEAEVGARTEVKIVVVGVERVFQQNIYLYFPFFNPFRFYSMTNFCDCVVIPLFSSSFFLYDRSVDVSHVAALEATTNVN